MVARHAGIELRVLTLAEQPQERYRMPVRWPEHSGRSQVCYRTVDLNLSGFKIPLPRLSRVRATGGARRAVVGVGARASDRGPDALKGVGSISEQAAQARP